MRGIPLIIAAVLLGAIGQVVMKRGMQIYGQVSATSVWSQLIPILKTPQVSIGLACYAVSAVLWIAVVSNVDLSLAYPMVSLAYVFVFLASWLLLGELLLAVELPPRPGNTLLPRHKRSRPRCQWEPRVSPTGLRAGPHHQRSRGVPHATAQHEPSLQARCRESK